MEFYKPKYSGKKRSRKGTPDGKSASFRNSRYGQKESATVTCADCGTECEIPFVPKTNRPVYCSDCFRQNKPEDTGRERFRHQDSRGPSHDTARKKPSSESKSRSDKHLRKQESFYENGSEKFYASLKEKLFEILGGKTCSSCGFKDERALGFSHKFDTNVFDSVRRGGAASSWGKYISAPKTAREDLKVLCLNCNAISQPVSRPKNEPPVSKPKKHRRFPR